MPPIFLYKHYSLSGEVESRERLDYRCVFQCLLVQTRERIVNERDNYLEGKYPVFSFYSSLWAGVVTLQSSALPCYGDKHEPGLARNIQTINLEIFSGGNSHRIILF